MAGFSEDTIEQVRAASDIVDVIGSYIPLKRAGANFVALCPFHREKSPSFNVNPQRQIFHCFGCGKGGDVFTFVKEHENIPFPDAVRRLAERAKITIELDTTPGQKQTRHIKDTLLQIHEQICQRWQNALANEACGQIARDYLVKRGVSEDAIKLFRLGYAPDVWDDTVNWAKSKAHELPLVEQGGLIIAKDGGGHYDRFRGRLMFPICDDQGRVIGFSGRILSGDEKTAKYVNSPETPIFTKGRVFFGLDKSKRALSDEDCAIVCEGQLDLIACFMAGVKNIVAPQGTALTSEHARILKRYVDEVVLCFDSDNAGQKAIERSLDSLLAAGLAVRVAVVPEPHKDPDAFIKALGGDAFKQVIGKAEGFFDHYLNRLCATNDLTTDKGRLTVLHSMAEAVHKTGNVVLVDKYAQKTALRLGVSPEAVRVEFRKAARLKKTVPVSGESGDAGGDEISEQVAAGSEPEPLPRPSQPEYWLMKLLLLNEDLLAWTQAHLDPAWIQHSHVREIVIRRLELHASGAWQGVAAFLTQCERPQMRVLLTEATADDRAIENAAQQISDITLRLRNQFIDRQLTALTHRAAQPELNDEQRLQILQQQQSLRQQKRLPLAPLPGSEEEPF